MFEVLRIRWEVAEEIMGPYLSSQVPTLLLLLHISVAVRSLVFVFLFVCLNDGKAGGSASLLATILPWQLCILVCIFHVA